MAYIPNNCTLEQYEEQIYSGDIGNNDLYIKHGNTVIGSQEEGFASPFSSYFSLKRRILKSGSNIFSLDSFISHEIDLTLHNYKIEDVNEDIEIKLITFIDSINTNVEVPLGIYKIQENPTTDNGKTTYKLRDKSVNFDFNYNAQPLIENSEHIDESGNKYVTKLEILLDICSQANIEYVGTRTFYGYNDPIGIYDNTIKARQYVAYIMEQAGLIATMNRYGQLTSIDLTTTPTREISEDIVENFKNGTDFEISKVAYESGTILFESGDDTKDTLFINSANPYIDRQEQIDYIYNKFKGFKINSFSTGQILGNPTIDPYDLLKLQYNGNIYITLAQYTLTFGGTMINKYDTTISASTKSNNTTINGQPAIKKYLKQEIDNVKGTLTIESGNIDALEQNISQLIIANNELTIRVSTMGGTVDGQQQVLQDMKSSFTTEGLKISTQKSKTNSLLNNEGIKVYNYSTLTAIFNHNGSGVNDLIVTNSIQLQNLMLKKRRITTRKHGTIDVISGFWLENLIKDLTDLEGD